MMAVLQEKSVQRRLGLKLVTTSLACCGPLPEAPQTAAQAIVEGDAMAATPQLAEQQQRDAVTEAVESSPAMQVSTSLYVYVATEHDGL